MTDDRKRWIDAEWDQAYDEWISGAWMYEPGGPFAPDETDGDVDR